VPDLVRTLASVVVCAAEPVALDRLASLESASVLRAAPDEVLLVGPPEESGAIVAAATRLVTDADPDAVVLDATDGWTVWTLAGPGRADAFERLSALELPSDGWVQGRVAGVPAKVVVATDAIHLLFPAMWSEHVRALVWTTCSDLGMDDVAEPHPWRSRIPEGRVTR
jgi:sarcosine oxidase gamma subunit